MKEPHILLAPDSFKGSLSSTEAASCMEEVYDAYIQMRLYGPFRLRTAGKGLSKRL